MKRHSSILLYTSFFCCCPKDQTWSEAGPALWSCVDCLKTVAGFVCVSSVSVQLFPHLLVFLHPHIIRITVLGKISCHVWYEYDRADERILPTCEILDPGSSPAHPVLFSSCFLLAFLFFRFFLDLIFPFYHTQYTQHAYDLSFWWNTYMGSSKVGNSSAATWNVHQLRQHLESDLSSWWTREKSTNYLLFLSGTK